MRIAYISRVHHQLTTRAALSASGEFKIEALYQVDTKADPLEQLLKAEEAGEYYYSDPFNTENDHDS